MWVFNMVKVTSSHMIMIGSRGTKKTVDISWLFPGHLC